MYEKRKTRCLLGLAAILPLSAALAAPASALTMTGWDIGWNDMATISGGSTTPQLSDSGNLQALNIAGANVSFSTADFFDNNIPGEAFSWANASGDQGQHFLDGTIRNAWYSGPVLELTAYDWDGSTGQPAGDDFEWLINNYSRDSDGNPSGDPRNSWIRGTDSSFTYNLDTGEFVANLSSTGIWHWYTTTTADSPMSGWIQNWGLEDTPFSAYANRSMTGNFRLVGSFTDGDDGLPMIMQASLQYEVADAEVPAPATLALLGLGLAGLGFRRRASKR